MMHFVLFSDGGAAVSYRNTWFLHFLPNPTKPNCGIQRLNLRTIFKPRIVLSSLQEQYFEIVVRPFLSSQLLLIFFSTYFLPFFLQDFAVIMDRKLTPLMVNGVMP